MIFEIILNYGKFGEKFEIKGASQKQVIELRRKIVNSFTKKEIDITNISKNIMNCESVDDLLNKKE